MNSMQVSFCHPFYRRAKGILGTHWSFPHLLGSKALWPRRRNNSGMKCHGWEWVSASTVWVTEVQSSEEVLGWCHGSVGKSCGLNSVLRTHMVERENDSCKLVYDLHIHAMTCAHARTHTIIINIYWIYIYMFKGDGLGLIRREIKLNPIILFCGLPSFLFIIFFGDKVSMYSWLSWELSM